MHKKVALFANGWNSENLDNFILGIEDYIKDDGVDIFIFTSHSAFSVNSAIIDAENSIYTMPDYSFFDAAIIYGSGLNSDKALKQIIDNCRKANIPTVLQGDSAEGFSSVTVDNYAGMRELCDHLIEKHNVKNTVFIAGAKENEDSNQRLQALKDSLEAHNLEFDDNNIVWADWETMLVRAHILEHYSTHKEKLPDAFICANDPMALYTLLTLQSLGYEMPRDVIVTGYDNLNDAILFYPSVSTVDQCYRDQGYACAEIIMRLIAGDRTIENKIIPSKVRLGESCGCSFCIGEKESRRELGHSMLTMKYRSEMNRGLQFNIELAVMGCDDYKKIPEALCTEAFSRNIANTDEFHFYINPQYKDLHYMDAKNKDYSDCYYSDVMEVMVVRTDDGVCHDRTIDRSKNLLLGYTGEGKPKRLIITPVRIESGVIGYMVISHTESGFLDRKYVEFRGSVGRTFEKYQSTIKLSKLNDKLTKLNNKLVELMQKDSLTGVKNRTAYDEYMENVEDLITDGNSQVSIIMCDVNNLKKINDNLGHDGGDSYIKNCCHLICNLFTHSPVFRTGGDEFVVVLTGDDYANREDLIAKLNQELDRIYQEVTLPVERISIAAGMADFDPAKDKSIYDTVKRADAFMYQRKAEMKARFLA